MIETKMKSSAKLNFGNGVLQRVRQRMVNFVRSDSGTVTIETVIVVPILLVCLQATYAFFEGYRHKSLALKANYAVADFLSRTHAYDQGIVDGMDELFEYMTRSSDSGWVRVTVVECNVPPFNCNDDIPRAINVTLDGDGVLNSHASDGVQPHNNERIRNQLASYIPKMYRGEHLIVVETSAQFRPTFAGHWTGIHSPEFYNITVTSPREYDTLCWRNATNPCPVPNNL